MTIQLHADGIYRFLLDEKDLVNLRDWAATLTNSLTKDTLEYLERRKVEEKQKAEERQLRVKRIPLDRTDELIKTEKRISAESFEALAPTLPPEPTPKPLVEYPPNRIVNTNQGKLEVAFDVTDKELNEMGYLIVSSDKNHNSDNTETN